jgi:hypothetical protein
LRTARLEVSLTGLLRHSVLWTLRDTTTPEQRVEMLKGLAFLRTECMSVSHGDYGDDLFGGSRDLQLVPPTGRTPMWRREGDAPPSNFDVALHLDFVDLEAADDYSADPTHTAASRFNESVSWDELTARVDWLYDGEAPTQRGHVKHAAMFVWADDAGDAARQRAVDAVQELGQLDGVERVTVGHSVQRLTSDYDWILDVQLPDRPAAERLLNGAAYAHAMEAVAAVTKYEWTARVTHLMHGRS